MFLIVYKNFGFDMVNYFKVYVFFENEIMFFFYIKLSDEEVDYIIEIFKIVFEKVLVLLKKL